MSPYRIDQSFSLYSAFAVLLAAFAAYISLFGFARAQIPEVVLGLKKRFEVHEKNGDKEKAEIAFRTIFRLTNKNPGRPKYPSFNWGHMQYLLHHSTKQYT